MASVHWIGPATPYPSPGTIMVFSVLLGMLAVSLYAMATKSSGAAGEAAPRALKFELYKDKRGEFRWRLKAGNGSILATAGESFVAKADAVESITRIKKHAASDKLTFEVYLDKASESRWRLKSTNGQIVASSSESYVAKADCTKAINLIKEAASKAKLDDQTA